MGVRCRLFNGLGGSIQAYGAMKDDNLVLSAVAGSDSTSYSYACITVERLSAWCVCLEEWCGGVRFGRCFHEWNRVPEQSRSEFLSFQLIFIISLFLSFVNYELCV